MSRLTVDLSDEIDERLNDIAKRNGITKGEAMRRAFALLSVADEERNKGNTLAIIDSAMKPLARLVGVF